jgi:hypothetical protein
MLALTFFAKGAEIMHDALHLYGALMNPWRCHRFGPNRRKPGYAEFVWFIAITPLTFLFRHGILPGGECELVDLRDQIFRWQIDYTLARADEVVRGLSHLAQAKHAAAAQPPCRRHRRQVRRAVWVQRADERYGSSEVEDGRFDGLVHGQTISEWCEPGYPNLAVKTRIALLC